MMRPRFLLIALLAVLSLAGYAHGQIPDKFNNLKVLPKDISKRELVDVMRNFSMALGTRCKYCHVEGKDPNSLEGYDFESDDKDAKGVAREMMKMAQEINANLLPAAKLEDPTAVRCITCHRGLENPETLDNVVLGVAGKDGVKAAADRYRELRQNYYGRGGYDFGPETLEHVAETLAQEKSDLDGAITIAQLNIEFYPEEARAHILLGQLYASKGDNAAAIASFERSLELEPGNPWATQLLEKARSSK